jgi:hypothetical protein
MLHISLGFLQSPIVEPALEVEQKRPGADYSGIDSYRVSGFIKPICSEGRIISESNYHTVSRRFQHLFARSFASFLCSLVIDARITPSERLYKLDKLLVQWGVFPRYAGVTLSVFFSRLLLLSSKAPVTAATGGW